VLRVPTQPNESDAWEVVQSTTGNTIFRPSGILAGKTNWNYLDTAGFTRGAGGPPQSVLNTGNENGKNWIPAECDVSIRPGWFYHTEEDNKVKTGGQLFDLYLKSVGRGANLLLNVPPDRRGLIHENDSAALMGFKKSVTENFKNNTARTGKGFYIPHNGFRSAPALNDGKTETTEAISIPHLQTLGLAFQKAARINCIVLRENLTQGQNCASFTLNLVNGKQEMLKEIKGTTIGRKRVITFPALWVNEIILSVNQQKSATGIAEIEAYLVDENLIEK
jgi:alpha-L-fucosidase